MVGSGRPSPTQSLAVPKERQSAMSCDSLSATRRYGPSRWTSRTNPAPRPVTYQRAARRIKAHATKWASPRLPRPLPSGTVMISLPSPTYCTDTPCRSKRLDPSGAILQAEVPGLAQDQDAGVARGQPREMALVRAPLIADRAGQFRQFDRSPMLKHGASLRGVRLRGFPQHKTFRLPRIIKVVYRSIRKVARPERSSQSLLQAADAQEAAV